LALTVYISSPHKSLDSPEEAARPRKMPVTSEEAQDGTEPMLHMLDERTLGRFSSCKSNPRVLGLFLHIKKSYFVKG